MQVTMSKGSMFWSNARGKVGDVVLSTVKGQTITRKYQPSPANPRTDAQQLQRAKFSNAVKFYKHAQQAYFRFAYEDRKKTESDYNAFMRYNAGVAMLPTRSQYLGKYPSIGGMYQVAAGSLPSIDKVVRGNQDIQFGLGSATWSATPTVGQASTALISQYGLQSGDIITLLRIACYGTNVISSDPKAYPMWVVSQFRIDESSDQSLTDAISDDGWSVVSESDDYRNLKATIDDEGHVMAAIIVSRVMTSGTKVSNAYLYLDDGLQEIYTQSLADSWRTAALASWAASGAAILQGSLSE